MTDLESRTEPQHGTFDAVINAVHHHWIVLDNTRFDPTTPGRESDTGYIDGIPVGCVEAAYPGLLHRVNNPRATQGLAMGQRVRARVDIPRRCRLMRLHSLQHLMFLGYQLHHGRVERLAGHVSDTVTTLEVGEHRAPSEPDVDSIQRWVNRVVADNLVITSLSRPPARGRQFWHVDGVGTIACEGRHPDRTGKIGSFRLHHEPSTDGVIRVTATLHDV